MARLIGWLIECGLILSPVIVTCSFLKPDMGKKAKNKTQIKKKTLNPEFNEVNVPSYISITTQYQVPGHCFINTECNGGLGLCTEHGV